MKPFFIAFSFLVFICACGKENKTSDADKKSEQPQTTQNNENKSTQQDNNNTNSQNAAGNNNELKDVTYDAGKLPAGIKYDGKVVTSAKWTDKNGENYIIVTETPEKNQNADERMKELFGYHYVLNGDDLKQLWKINDFIKDCPVDITLQYMPKSLSITDLDKNGIAETIFLYRMSCKGDVSEDDMKLIMHEGETKYAIRGSMILKMGGETYGGKTNIDASFDKAPMEFLSYAKEQWGKFQTETVGN